MIPNCLLEKTNKEMMTLKRVPRALFRDPETIRRVESDNFLQVVIDCYAYAAWPHLGLGKKMEVYSGYDPGWIVAHAAPLWINALEDLELLPDAEAFYRTWQAEPDKEIGFCSMEYMSAVVRLAVQKVMVEDRYPAFFEVGALRTMTDAPAGSRPISGGGGITRGRSIRPSRLWMCSD